MIAKGYSPLDLFTGPTVVNGFVDEKELKNKTNEIYVSEIKELIENIKGVVSVDQIDIFQIVLRLGMLMKVKVYNLANRCSRFPDLLFRFYDANE